MDLQTLIIIGIIVALVAYLINRNQSGANNNNPEQRGSERPRYDAPDVQGRGSFGSDRGNQSQSSNTQRRDNPTPRNDSSDVQGKGSFGRDKD